MSSISPKLEKIIENLPTGPCVAIPNSSRYTHVCPDCGAYCDTAEVLGEIGWYVRTVGYKCGCGKWYSSIC